MIETEKVDTSIRPDNQVPLLRGSLKFEVSSATPIVSAGEEFSIYVTIRNPFPVPITVYSTETHIPVELSDQIWCRNQSKKREKDRSEELGKAKTFSQKTLIRMKYLISDLHRWLRPPSSPRVAVAVSPEIQSTIESFQGSIVVDGGVNSERDVIFGSQWNLDFKEMSPEQVRQIFWDINEYKQGKQPVTLCPGDSVVQHFILKTTHWLTFAPIAHTFQIQVRYEVDGMAHSDTVPFALNIRAATLSALIGALIGSVLGSIVNTSKPITDWPQAIRTLLTAGIFAVIIVVAFARKNNVQQIVSVEDFWGGIFIGFLVGYTGEAFIKAVLG